MQFNEPNLLSASQLGIAARFGDENTMLSLLKKGSRVDVCDNRGWNAIHEAVAANHITCLKLLLKKGRQDVNQRTVEGETPLLFACSRSCKGNVDLIRLLLDNGANVNLGNNENFTPLHLVCKNGKLEIAEILIEAGAKLNERNHIMWTPLHFAVSSVNVAIMKLLLSKGADISVQDENNRTPLFLACERCDLNIVEPLIKYYDFVDTRRKDGFTALMMASQCGNLKVVQELLKKGANPNLAAYDHTMAIHLAVHTGVLSVVQLLLEVTNKEAILEHCTHPDVSFSGGLCSLAIYCENFEVLEALVKSDLGNDILHLPTCIEGFHFFTLGEPSFEFIFRYSSPVNFLLERKLNDMKEDTIAYLELLLKHNFPANPINSEHFPPLVTLCCSNEEDDTTMRCIDLLLAYGADIDYSIQYAGIPNALLTACLSGNCLLLLKLLRAGCSGLPDDLLRCVLTKQYRTPVEIPLKWKMVNCLLELGITEPSLYRQLRHICNAGSGNLIKPLAEFQMCSLQQLCRVAVRRNLRQPFSQSLNNIMVPKCIKDYLIYKLL